MIANRAEVKALIAETVPELVVNVDEMWRRQLRDGEVKTLRIDAGHKIDVSVASPAIFLEHGHLGTRAVAQSEYGGWARNLRKPVADASPEFDQLKHLALVGSTYRDFDTGLAFEESQLFALARRLPGLFLCNHQSPICEPPSLQFTGFKFARDTSKGGPHVATGDDQSQAHKAITRSFGSSCRSQNKP